MSEIINVEVPSVGESITEVQIGQWYKAVGDWIEAGEDLVEIETEKASVPVPAPVSGVIDQLLLAKEDFANVGDVIASIRPGDKPAGGPSVDAGSSKPAQAQPPTGQSMANAPAANAPRPTLPRQARRRLEVGHRLSCRRPNDCWMKTV